MSSSEEAAEPRKPSKKEKLINNEWVVGYSNTYHKKYYFNIYTNNAVWNVHEMQSINTVKNLKKHRIREPDCPPTDQVAVSTSPQRPDDKRAPSTKPTQAHRQPTCNSPTALLTPFAPFATGNLQNNQPNNIEQPNPFLNPNIWMRPNPVQFANQTQGLNTWTNLSNVPQMNFGMPTNLNNGLQNFGTIPTNFSNFPAPNFGNPGSFVNMNPNFVFPSAGNFPNFVNPGSTFHSTPSGSNVNLSNFGVNFSNFNSNNKSDSSEFVSPNAHNLNASQFNTPNSDVSKNSTSSGNSQSYFNSPDNAVTWIKATNVPMSQRFLKEHKITDHRVISKGNGQTLPILSFTQSPSENEESEYDVERDKEFHSQNVDDLYLTEEEDGGREKLKECDLRLKLIAKRRASCNNDQLIDRVPEVRKRRNSVSGDLLEKAVNMHISEDKLQDEDETDDETDTIAKSELNAIKNKGSSLGRELLKRAEPGVSRDICYVICDTNIFIDGLLFVKQLVFSDDDNLIRIVVPWRIHNELEGILKGRNIQILSKKKARDINRFLHDESMKEHSVYIGQKPPSIIQCLNPDDEILDCCMQYVKKKNHVVLITNDKPLLTKARYANIQVYNLEQMQKMLDLVKEPQVDSLMKMKISINNSLAFVKPQRNTDNVTSRTQNVESSDNQMYQGLQSQSNQKPSNVKLPVNIWQRLSNTESNQNVPSNSWQIPANSGIPNISLWQNTTNAGIHNISSWQMPSNPGIPAQPIWQNMHSSANMQMPMNVPLMSNSQNFPSAPWQIPTTYNPAFSQPSSFANATFNHSIVNTNISTEQESSTTNSPRVSTKSNNTQSSSTIVSSRNASTWCLGNPSERDSEGKDENMPTGLTNETAKKQENTAATDVNNTDDYIHNNNTGTRKIQLKRKPMEASYYYAPKKPRRLWRNRPCKPSVPVWSFQCTSTTQNPNVPPQPTSVPPQPTYVPPQSTSVPPQPTSAQNIGFNTDNSQGVQNASYAKDQSIPTSNAQIGISNAPNLENEPNCKKDTALNNTNTLSINKTQSQITITDNRLLSVSKDLATSYDWTKYKINRRPELQAPKRMYTIDMRANSDKDMDNEESAKNAGATSLDIDSRTMRTRLWKRTDEWACVFVQAMENLLSDILWQSKSPNYLLPPPWNLHEAAVCIQKLHEKDKQIASTAGGFAAVVEQATTRNNPDVDVVAKVSQKKKIIFSTVMPSSPKLFMEMYKQGVGLITALKEKYPESEDILMTEHVLSELLLDIRYAGRDKRFTEINQFVEIADEHPVSQDNADTNITDECPSPETRDNYGDIIQYLKKHFAEWESYKEGTESLTRPNLKKRKKNTETKDSKTDKLEIHNKNETHLLDNKSKTNKDIITANTIFNDDAYYAVKANEMYDKDENAVTENIVNAEGTKKEPKIVRNLNCVLPEFEELLKQKKAISGNLDDDFDYEDDYEGDENYYCDEHFHYEDGEYDEYDYDENIDNNEEQDTVKDGPLVNGDKISANNEPNLAVNGDYEPDDVNQINNEENNVNEEDENVNEKDMEVCEENNNVVNQFDLARVTSTIIKAHKNVRAYLVMQVRKQMQVDVPNSDGDPSLLPADTELKEALKGFNRCMRDVISGKPEVAAGLTAYLLRLVPDGGPLPDPDVIYRIFSQQKDILQNAVRHFEMLLKILDALPVHSNNGIPREATNTLYSFVAEQSLDTYMEFRSNASMKRDKEEEDGGSNPFQNLDKTSVLQEARYFNESPVNHRKCAHILTKILYLLNQGEKLSTQEATDVFFATTKLFQSKDVVLRRMVYLCIKELSGIADDVIIVTSSLTKDMTGSEDLYRAAAIRALCSITDNTMLQAIERYMKQAIVDKNPAVSSAALVSALHLSGSAPDLVRRWANEAQEAISSDNAMVSYHALGVVAAARRNDRLATAKLVTRLVRQPLKSPYALCLFIRLAARLVDEDDSEASEQYIGMIETCLRHKSEMVIYEAAHAIVNLRRTARDLAPAVSVLQLFCGSSKASLRLAGARTLARLTTKHPAAVAACAVDLENLISDSNRSVATLAVTTLLATGAESSVDRLMKQIASFVSEISDEFKIVVVRAIRRLCSKFPRKHQALAAFLAGMLRDEGGLEYKAAIADAIIALVEENPDAKESGLAHLCEFIEDCEHTALAVRILHLLGREGPRARHPSRYIRFVYNRVILESGPVRAAAVSAVAQFGAARPELLPNVRILLARCRMDDDDEVRDRALYYGAILDTGDRQLIEDYIVDVPKPSAAMLERALRDHLAARPDEPFDLLAVPTADEPEERHDVAAEVEARRPAQATREERYAEVLSAVPGIERYGPLFRTCEPVELTEAETEYRVRCVKHVFARHLVLQFECVNTLSDQLLERVSVKLEPPAGYNIISEWPCERLPYDREGNVFCVLEFPEQAWESLGTFGATLEFCVKDCDPTSGAPEPGDGYADSYPLEEVEIGCAEQVRARPATDEWEAAWERAGTAHEACDTFVLSQTDAGEAAKAVCTHLGLPAAAISGSDPVREVRGGGVWRGSAPVLVRARLATAAGGVTMQLAARSPREDVAQLLLAAVG